MSDIENVSASSASAAQAAAAKGASERNHEEKAPEAKAPDNGATESAAEPETETASVYNTVGGASNSTIRGTGVSVVV